MSRNLLLALVVIFGFAAVLQTTRVSYTQEPATGEAGSDVGIKYAQACLRLANVELKRAQELNREMPLVSPLRLERLKFNVEVARTQVEIAKKYQHGSTMPLQLAYAEATAELAKRNLENAENARRVRPKLVPPLRIERLQAKAEVARLRAAMWRDTTYLPSLVDQMQWQIDRLTEEIIELNQKVQELAKEP